MRADLSIIVVNYNKPPSQIEECFESLRQQTVQPKEIFFVDDCSDDPRAHADAISILLPENKGVAHARDIGVRMSTGRLLLFVDADDKLAPDFIQQCGKQISKTDIVYPNMLLFGHIERNKLIENPNKLTPSHIMNRKSSIPVTSMMHRYVYETLNGFRDIEVFEDWDFWIRAMFNGYTFSLANTLLWYRQNPVSRNRQSTELKTKVYNEMTQNYVLRKGKICLKESD